MRISQNGVITPKPHWPSACRRRADSDYLVRSIDPNLDRLCDAVVRCTTNRDKGILVQNQTRMFPSAIAAGSISAGVLAPAAMAAFHGNDGQKMTRREHLKKLAVFGGVVGGFVALGEAEEVQASVWGVVSALVFAPVITWVVQRTLNWAWYQLTANDLTQNRNPTPTNSSFHNSYSPNHEVSNMAKRFRRRRVGRFTTSFGMDEYTLTLDLNYPEANQIREEVNDGCLDGPILPETRRIPMNQDRHGEAVQRVAQSYRYRAGDYDVEYVNALTDRLGRSHLGVGVTVDREHQFLISEPVRLAAG